MKLKWSFTIVLGLVYLAVFHLWLKVSPARVMASACGATLLLGFLFCRAVQSDYFVNHWDAAIHASVILDILLEGLLIRWHEHYGFYLCAAAFAVVLIGYRSTFAKGTRQA